MSEITHLFQKIQSLRYSGILDPQLIHSLVLIHQVIKNNDTSITSLRRMITTMSRGNECDIVIKKDGKEIDSGVSQPSTSYTSPDIPNSYDAIKFNTLLDIMHIIYHMAELQNDAFINQSMRSKYSELNNQYGTPQFQVNDEVKRKAALIPITHFISLTINHILTNFLTQLISTETSGINKILNDVRSDLNRKQFEIDSLTQELVQLKVKNSENTVSPMLNGKIIPAEYYHTYTKAWNKLLSNAYALLYSPHCIGVQVIRTGNYLGPQDNEHLSQDIESMLYINVSHLVVEYMRDHNLDFSTLSMDIIIECLHLKMSNDILTINYTHGKGIEINANSLVIHKHPVLIDVIDSVSFIRILAMCSKTSLASEGGFTTLVIEYIVFKMSDKLTDIYNVSLITKINTVNTVMLNLTRNAYDYCYDNFNVSMLYDFDVSTNACVTNSILSTVISKYIITEFDSLHSNMPLIGPINRTAEPFLSLSTDDVIRDISTRIKIDAYMRSQIPHKTSSSVINDGDLVNESLHVNYSLGLLVSHSWVDIRTYNHFKTGAIFGKYGLINDAGPSRDTTRVNTILTINVGGIYHTSNTMFNGTLSIYSSVHKARVPEYKISVKGSLTCTFQNNTSYETCIYNSNGKLFTRGNSLASFVLHEELINTDVLDLGTLKKIKLRLNGSVNNIFAVRTEFHNVMLTFNSYSEFTIPIIGPAKCEGQLEIHLQYLDESMNMITIAKCIAKTSYAQLIEDGVSWNTILSTADLSATMKTHKPAFTYMIIPLYAINAQTNGFTYNAKPHDNFRDLHNIDVNMRTDRVETASLEHCINISAKYPESLVLYSNALYYRGQRIRIIIHKFSANIEYIFNPLSVAFHNVHMTDVSDMKHQLFDVSLTLRSMQYDMYRLEDEVSSLHLLLNQMQSAESQQVMMQIPLMLSIVNPIIGMVVAGIAATIGITRSLLNEISYEVIVADTFYFIQILLALKSLPRFQFDLRSLQVSPLVIRNLINKATILKTFSANALKRACPRINSYTRLRDKDVPFTHECTVSSHWRKLSNDDAITNSYYALLMKRSNGALSRLEQIHLSSLEKMRIVPLHEYITVKAVQQIDNKKILKIHVYGVSDGNSQPTDGALIGRNTGISIGKRFDAETPGVWKAKFTKEGDSGWTISTWRDSTMDANHILLSAGKKSNVSLSEDALQEIYESITYNLLNHNSSVVSKSINMPMSFEQLNAIDNLVIRSQHDYHYRLIGNNCQVMSNDLIRVIKDPGYKPEWVSKEVYNEYVGNLGKLFI